MHTFSRRAVLAGFCAPDCAMLLTSIAIAALAPTSSTIGDSIQRAYVRCWSFAPIL